MNVHVLVDNNSIIDRYFLAEPGFSVLIEEGECRILFDTGYSDIFIRNSQKMGLDLSHLDFLVLSHSHMDHTWGLDPLIRYFAELRAVGIPCSKPAIVAHSETFTSVVDDTLGELGCLLSPEKLARHFQLELTDKPLWLTDRLVFLGEIPRKNTFESIQGFGRKEGSAEEDRVIEDSALAYTSDNGLVIISGCSHAGICNIIEYAREVCKEERIHDVLGDLHLQEPSPHQMQNTLAYIHTLNMGQLHACHCTDLQSKIALSQVVDIQEVGVGMSLHY